MAVDDRHILARIPSGAGRSLDLGGTLSRRRRALEERGYTYVNLDLKPGGPRKVQGDAHRMPFVDASFSLVVCSDAFDSLPALDDALVEIRRVLAPGGTFIFWAPFIHQFGGDDLYRFSPRGIAALLQRTGFEMTSLEAPDWVFGLLAEVPDSALKKLHVRGLERFFEWIGKLLDRVLHRETKGFSVARAFIVTCRPVAAAEPIDVQGRRRSLRSRPTVTEERMQDRIPAGTGTALDLDGGRNARSLRERGYTVIEGDASTLSSIEPGALSAIASSRGLGPFADPFTGIAEIRSALAEGGRLVAWMPYLDPWDGREHMRVTPLGLAVLLRQNGFRVAGLYDGGRLLASVAAWVAHGLRLPAGGRASSIVERAGMGTDAALRRSWGLGYAFARGWVLDAVAEGGPRAGGLLEARDVPVEILWAELGDERAAAVYRDDRLAKERRP